jgi:hypothetical protein
VDWLLFLGRFAIPLLLLLSRALKRSAAMLAALAGWMIFTTAVELAWFVLPSSGLRLSTADALPFIAIGALTWACGVHLLAVRPAPAVVDEAAVTDALRYRSP